MTLLDRTIARHYLANVGVLFLVLCAFVVAIDVTLNFDEFLALAGRNAGGTSGEPSLVRQGVIALFLVFDFWWPKLCQLYNYMIGLVMVGAMGFTLAQMARHRELIAVMSGGISLLRVARPILLVALLLTALQAANHELLLPRIAPLLTRDHHEAGGRTLGAARIPLCADARGNLFYARVFDADRGSVEGFYYCERSHQGLAVRRITADRATWRDGGWDLVNGLAAVEERAGPGGPATAAIDRVETDLDPLALTLRRFAGFRQSLSWAQLGQMLRRPDLLDQPTRERLDDLERIRWGRLSVMITNPLTLLTCLWFFLRREPGGMVRRALLCAPVAMTALIGGVLASGAEIPSIPAALGVFIPVMVLAPLAVASLTSVRT